MLSYPFDPKSTRFLEPGQFWPVPLPDGRFGCGRVLQKIEIERRTAPRTFHAGLMDWCGASPPTFRALAGRSVAFEFLTHVKTIPLIGAQITGIRELALDAIAPSLWRVFHSANGDCYVSVNGSDRLRPATPHERAFLKDVSIWYGDMIVQKAEQLCANSSPHAAND